MATILLVKRPGVREQNLPTFPTKRAGPRRSWLTPSFLGAPRHWHPGPARAPGGPFWLVGRNRSSEAAFHLEGLLSVWDFPVSVSVCSQELLFQSVDRYLLNTLWAVPGSGEIPKNKNLVLSLKDRTARWRDRR